MKKKYFLYFLIFSSIGITSCSNKESKVEVKEIAEAFLIDFYYNSFENIKINSDKSTKEFLDYIEKNDELEYRSQNFNEIDSVVLTTKDSALVYYSYENSYYEEDKHILPLINQKGTWLVHIENTDNIDFYRFVFDYSISKVKEEFYQELKNEEVVEIDLLMSTFIKQVNHPKMVVGILGSNSIFYYDIEDLENYKESHSYFWKDLSTLSAYVYLDFNTQEVLSEVEYFISDIETSNVLGVFEKIENSLIEEYGEPFNNQYMEKEDWYKSVKWFVKGKNEIIELLNNEDGTISLLVTSSIEDNDSYEY